MGRLRSILSLGTRAFAASALAFGIETLGLAETAPLPWNSPRQCKSGSGLIPSALMNPVGFRSYLEANSLSLRTPDDLICCLPLEYRENYAIAHSSKAGQNSDPEGPRILLFNRIRLGNGKQQVLQAVVSINGGQSTLNNATNVEAMFNEEGRREVSYFDYEFKTGRVVFGERNPQPCMACHANGGPPGPGGPRTVFDPIPHWPRFIKGLFACNDGERALLRAMEPVVASAVATNPRYRCLAPRSDGAALFAERGSQPASLADLDRQLADLNDRRLATVIRGTRDYEDYKYAVFGSLVCQPGRFATNKEIDSASRALDGWLPKRLRSEHQDAARVQPRLASAQSASALRSVLMEELSKQAAENARLITEQRSAAAAFENGGAPQFRFSSNAMVCRDPANSVFCDGPIGTEGERLCRADPVRREAEDATKRFTDDQSLNRFIADSYLGSFRGEVFNPYLRYLFEGRGISMADWSTDAVPGLYSRSPLFLARRLMELEPRGSPLKQLEPQMRAAGLLLGPSEFSLNPAPKEPVCDRLKELSMGRLSSLLERRSGAARRSAIAH